MIFRPFVDSIKRLIHLANRAGISARRRVRATIAHRQHVHVLDDVMLEVPGQHRTGTLASALVP